MEFGARGLHRGYIGIVEKKMEATIKGLGFGMTNPKLQYAVVKNAD